MTSTAPTDPTTLALMALATLLSDEARARRFLDLTGIDAAELRERAGDDSLLVAAIGFLEAYEPDLLAVAQEMGIGAQVIVAARRAIEGKDPQ